MIDRERGEKETLFGPSPLRLRTTPLPFPTEESNFNPLQATDDERRHFGLPTLDDQPKDSLSRHLRRAFLSPPSGGRLRFAQALTRYPVGGGAPTSRTTPAATSPWPAQKSSNWSGGYVVPRDGRSIVTVMGTWTVPAVAPPGGGTENDYRSSTWVGLDGQRTYRDSSLPQIGTKQVCNDAGEVTNSAWYQWWARGLHEGEDSLALPLAAGEEISAVITVLNATTVRFNLKNVSQGIMLQAFDVVAPPGYLISGATAEWIMERPSPLGSDGWSPYSLPAYRPFSFTGCLAESKASGETIATPVDLKLARLIRMYEIVDSPRSVRTISTARKILAPEQALELGYVGP